MTNAGKEHRETYRLDKKHLEMREWLQEHFDDENKSATIRRIIRDAFNRERKKKRK